MKGVALPQRSAPSQHEIDELLDTPDQETGRTPLEVMLSNMRFYDRQADRLLKQLEALIVRADDPRSRAEAQETLREFLAMREKAQACARDAAPFCHSRLQTTDHSPVAEREDRSAFDTLMLLGSSPEDQQKAAAAYQQLIKGVAR
jgi:hypothetical protein